MHTGSKMNDRKTPLLARKAASNKGGIPIPRSQIAALVAAGSFPRHR
jgi:hypothetical protein